MAYEIINSVKGKTIIRCVDAGTYTIQLTDLRANANIENVQSASITDLFWSTSGNILISRGGAPIMNLFSTGDSYNMEGVVPKAGANNKTANIQITIAGSGTVLMELSKDALYTEDINRALLNN